MNCSDNECVCSVTKENNLGYYRLHTIWKKDGFCINVTSKNGSWRGEMTPGDVARISSQLELEPESYMNQCKKALTYHGGQPGMAYAVEDGCFTWKKVEDEDSGIKIKMGSVMLEPTNFVDTIQDLVTVALNCNKKLQEKLDEVTEEKRAFLENRSEILDKLNGLIRAKETMENDLYSRFLILINAKKRKIYELENLLEEKKNKEYRDVIPKNLNPYDVDTDTECEEISTAGIEKISRKNDSVPQDAPEGKKAKNEDFNSGNVGCDCSNSPRMGLSEPSMSTNEAGSEGVLSNKINLTKDDLYNFFYGAS